LEELSNSETDSELVLQLIEELEETHQNEIEELKLFYDTQILDLENQLKPLTDFTLYELRSYKKEDPGRLSSLISNKEAAKTAYNAYLMYYVPEEVYFYEEVSLRQAIAESPYINLSVDQIMDQIHAWRLSYSSYWDGKYFIFWIIKPLIW